MRQMGRRDAIGDMCSVQFHPTSEHDAAALSVIGDDHGHIISRWRFTHAI